MSGYDINLSFLNDIDISKIQNALEILRNEIVNRKIRLWVGSCLFENNQWYNVELGFTPKGETHRYN
ncbi:MAG: hypothetical protein ACFFG0_53590 [Candidatus Thorarchaeota archaeon]